MPESRSTIAAGISVDAIVDQALELIASGGLIELTLRPLATRLGVSVAVISSRMGSKEQLLESAIEAAHRHDRAFYARWRSLSDAVRPADPAARAALAELALRDWIDSERRQLVVLIELVHHYALQPDCSPALAAWLDEAGLFWSGLIFGDPALAELALGYALDEAGFSLGAGDNDAYALLRSLCLQRFAAGIFPPAGAEQAADITPALIALLEPPALPAAPTEDPKRQHIAESAANLIVSEGIDRVTHRAVAAAAGVPASTVVYHFGGRTALVAAGLQAVIARFHSRRGDLNRALGNALRNETSTQDLVKATSMIALAGVREPGLAPYALDMRRRRGENIKPGDLPALGVGIGAGFDRATSQVFSVAVFGMGMIGMARSRSEGEHYAPALAAFEAWRTRRAG